MKKHAAERHKWTPYEIVHIDNVSSVIAKKKFIITGARKRLVSANRLFIAVQMPQPAIRQARKMLDFLKNGKLISARLLGGCDEYAFNPSKKPGNDAGCLSGCPLIYSLQLSPSMPQLQGRVQIQPGNSSPQSHKRSDWTGAG